MCRCENCIFNRIKAHTFLSYCIPLTAVQSGEISCLFVSNYLFKCAQYEANVKSHPDFIVILYLMSLNIAFTQELYGGKRGEWWAYISGL